MIVIKYKEALKRENLSIIKKVIARNGIIIYPTDTLYGIGGDFFSIPVIKKIDTLKNRKDMPYSAAVSGLDMLKTLVHEIPDLFFEIHKKILPGKFTILFEVSKSLNKDLVKSNNKIGIRIPDVPIILELIQELKVPLISTSVNRSGEEPLNDPRKIMEEFTNTELDHKSTVLIEAGVLPESRGSTVIDITESPAKVIRKGDDFEKLSKLGICV